MAIDIDVLEHRRSFSDPAGGIIESFVELEVGGARTVGVLSQPIYGSSSSTGWVISHSFGPDWLGLLMTEVSVARALAAAGDRVLRFQCQGYGDSAEVWTEPTVSTHLRDTRDAIGALRSMTDVERIGAIGCRMGGAVAALLADEGQIDRLVLVAPAVSGERYARELLRVRAIAGISSASEERAMSIEELREALGRAGGLSIKGFLLTDTMVADLERVDLLRQLRGSHGDVLIVQVSIGTTPQSSLGKLAAHLETLGANVTSEIVTDPVAPRFGIDHFQVVDRGVEVDVMRELYGALSSRIVSWADRTAEPGGQR
jgi:pimeloyl-ACP methyl ester carboxylesterase